MKIFNEPLITAPQDMSASFELPPVYLANIVNYSIQLEFTGAPTGTYSLQCSNDHGKAVLPGKIDQYNAVNNWTEIKGSAQDISEAGDHTWNVENAGYLWVRVVYAPDSGTGSLSSARVTVKGV